MVTEVPTLELLRTSTIVRCLKTSLCKYNKLINFSLTAVDTFYIGGSPYSPLDPNVNIPMQNVSDDRSLSPDLSVPSQLVASSVFDSVVFNDDSDDIDGQGSSNDMFGNDSNNTNSIDAVSPVDQSQDVLMPKTAKLKRTNFKRTAETVIGIMTNARNTMTSHIL